MDQTLLDELLVDWGGNPTLRQALGLYEKVGMPGRDLAERTCVEYGKDLRAMLSFLEGRGTIMVAQVSLLHLQAYQAEMIRRGYTPATRMRKAHAIKGLFTFLHGHGITQTDIADQLIPAHVPYREPRYLSKAEYTRLLAICSGHPRDRAIIELFLQTGMGLSELARLTVSDVELPSLITMASDGGGSVHVTRRGSRRTIPLNYKACRALQAWLAARPRSPHDALWVTRTGAPLSVRAIRHLVAEHLERAGITHASVHTLRHTMAVHHVAAGTDLEIIQKTLGHADIRTTERYEPLAKQTQRKALQGHAL